MSCVPPPKSGMMLSSPRPTAIYRPRRQCGIPRRTVSDVVLKAAPHRANDRGHDHQELA